MVFFNHNKKEVFRQKIQGLSAISIYIKIPFLHLFRDEKLAQFDPLVSFAKKFLYF